MLLNAWIQEYVYEASLAVFLSLYLGPGGGEDFITEGRLYLLIIED